MSKIALSGNSLGTGTFTIASPNSNTDRVVNLPDAGGDMVLTTATQTLTNKSIDSAQLTGNVAAARITDALNASGSAPIYACRAWVVFDGVNGVVVKASGNVSSVTRGSAGFYTINFATAMPDIDYSCVASARRASGSGFLQQASESFSTLRSTTAISFNTGATSTIGDNNLVSIAVFR